MCSLFCHMFVVLGDHRRVSGLRGRLLFHIGQLDVHRSLQCVGIRHSGCSMWSRQLPANQWIYCNILHKFTSQSLSVIHHSHAACPGGTYSSAGASTCSGLFTQQVLFDGCSACTAGYSCRNATSSLLQLSAAQRCSASCSTAAGATARGTTAQCWLDQGRLRPSLLVRSIAPAWAAAWAAHSTRAAPTVRVNQSTAMCTRRRC